MTNEGGKVAKCDDTRRTGWDVSIANGESAVKQRAAMKRRMRVLKHDIHQTVAYSSSRLIILGSYAK
ncbi:hypothetical protein TWF481_010838 [Arthrobotrys musiformis]|uniref:Uncharacterized protein n=1 Tax=Arthrobotrys musiformis TaxID=47236 RepID=A0AAV9W376_9PEZI